MLHAHTGMRNIINCATLFTPALVATLSLASGGPVAMAQGFCAAADMDRFDQAARIIPTTAGSFAAVGSTRDGLFGSDMTLLAGDGAGGLAFTLGVFQAGSFVAGHGIAEASDGGYLAVGEAVSLGGTEAVVARVDSTGALVYSARIDLGPGDSSLNDVIQLPNGNFVCTGSVGDHLLVLTTDSSGTPLMPIAVSAGPSLLLRGNKILELRDGVIAIAGEHLKPVSSFTGFDSSSVLVTLDPQLLLLDVQQITHNGGEQTRGVDVLQASDGQLFVLEQRLDSAFAFISRFTATGTVMTTELAPPGGKFEPHAFSLTKDGQLLIVGNDLVTNGIAAKMTTGGVFVGAQQIHVPDTVTDLKGVAVFSSGAAALFGDSTRSLPGPGNGLSDLMVAATDPTGRSCCGTDRTMASREFVAGISSIGSLVPVTTGPKVPLSIRPLGTLRNLCR